ncbi:hypothetical protein, partial [Elstera litoralis]|uniref:hypothetical protein n=1 Tax=Elstera litoralis TaxID=552518 RepID=UPI001E2AF8D3
MSHIYHQKNFAAAQYPAGAFGVSVPDAGVMCRNRPIFVTLRRYICAHHSPFLVHDLQERR